MFNFVYNIVYHIDISDELDEAVLKLNTLERKDKGNEVRDI
jgi:hypothetical protein